MRLACQLALIQMMGILFRTYKVQGAILIMIVVMRVTQAIILCLSLRNAKANNAFFKILGAFVMLSIWFAAQAITIKLIV